MILSELKGFLISNEQPIYTSANTVIYQAIQEETQKKVLLKQPAIKFPPESVLENFKKEFQFGKLLYNSFPDNFVQIHDLLETETSLVLVQTSESDSLDKILLEPNMNLERKLEIALLMTEALKNLHSLNIIHRDIKPSNFVMDSEKKTPKLIDFGISVMVSRKSPSVPCKTPTGTFHFMR